MSDLPSSAAGPAVHPGGTGRRRRLFIVYRTVLWILLSYGWLEVRGWVRGRDWREARLAELHRVNARRTKEAILRVQGLFIKVGQLLSQLASSLPREFRGDLEALQDRVPPRPLEEIRRRLVAELGAPPEELFEDFDPQPLASASLAQVHAARLSDGRRVAVKVQYPQVEAMAELDLRTLRRILAIVQWALRLRGLEGVFEEIEATIREELDFRQEAEHLERIAANFQDQPLVAFPPVLHELSSGRVLTTELVEGTKITDLAALRGQGIDLAALSERVLGAYCRMIFRDGLYHADPHPGNLMVRPDGTLVFIDFGAVGRLSPAMRQGILSFLEGMLQRDTAKVVAALQRMGFVRRIGEDEAAERILDAFYRRFLERIELDSWNLGELRIDARMKIEMMSDLRELGIGVREFGSTFQVPRQWVILMRTLVLLLGVCTELDPAMRPMPVLRPWVEEYVLDPQGGWMGLLGSTLKEMALAGLALPGDLQRFLAQAQRGRLQIEVRGLAASARLLYALGHQLLLGLFALASGGLAYHASLRGAGDLARALAGAGGTSLLLLGLSLLRARKLEKELRRRRRR